MEKKEKAPAHFSSKVMPVPLQLTGNGQQEKLNKEMGCCLLPAWAFDHLQKKPRIVMPLPSGFRNKQTMRAYLK